jgi:hypothetical protein
MKGIIILDKHCFDRKQAIERVFVKRAASTIRQNHDHRRPFARDDAFMQNLDVFKAVKLVPAVAVQVVNHRVSTLLICVVVIARWQIEAVPHVLPGCFALKRPMSDAGRKFLIAQFIHPDNRRTSWLLRLLLTRLS